MEITKEIKKDCYAVRLSSKTDGKEAGHIWLYILQNNLHKEPLGYLEDLFVDVKYRHQGIGAELVKKAIAEAKEQGCYKVIFTARHTKPETIAWYKKMGFAEHGVEFRVNLK